ncbi:unnamed protein product [Albugo candida]|uniref:Uncharacterized protein n=1 Tax=Albugo candida TaxID=65357 RepID=A0A024G8Q6_9STRA|nr:unnamed protein product [Albugo candida]|eukprot:CCI43143.1 unnamed protein product [Albugo candida]
MCPHCGGKCGFRGHDGWPTECHGDFCVRTCNFSTGFPKRCVSKEFQRRSDEIDVHAIENTCPMCHKNVIAVNPKMSFISRYGFVAAIKVIATHLLNEEFQIFHWGQNGRWINAESFPTQHIPGQWFHPEWFILKYQSNLSQPNLFLHRSCRMRACMGQAQFLSSLITSIISSNRTFECSSIGPFFLFIFLMANLCISRLHVGLLFSRMVVLRSQSLPILNITYGLQRDQRDSWLQASGYLDGQPLHPDDPHASRTKTAQDATAFACSHCEEKLDFDQSDQLRRVNGQFKRFKKK